MYVYITNGRAGITDSYDKVRLIQRLYPYTLVRNLPTKGHCIEYVLKHNYREDYSSKIYNYGNANKESVIKMEFFIKDHSIYYTFELPDLYSSVDILESRGIEVDNRGTIINVRVKSTNLGNSLITHQLLAVRRGLRIIGPFADVNVVLNDMSTYLLLKYTSSKMREVKDTEVFLEDRLGVVNLTVKEEIEV